VSVPVWESCCFVAFMGPRERYARLERAGWKVFLRVVRNFIVWRRVYMRACERASVWV
jgi:hypothetical protein